MFVCALRIEKVVPTVNVGSAAGRAKMKAWIERWLGERRKNGVLRLGDGEGEVRW
jgi:DNA cross-link repair 1A protein